MKAIALFIILSSFTLLSCSTNRGVSSAFKKYADREGVTAVSIPGWLIKLGSNFGDLEPEERALVRSLDKIKVLTIEDADLNSNINFNKEFYSKISRNKDYEELVKIKDHGDDICILGKIGKDRINELIILVSGSDNTIVYIKGDFKMKDLKKIIETSEKEDLIRKVAI